MRAICFALAAFCGQIAFEICWALMRSALPWLSSRQVFWGGWIGAALVPILIALVVRRYGYRAPWWLVIVVSAVGMVTAIFVVTVGGCLILCDCF